MSTARPESLRVAYVTQWFSPEPDGPPLWIAQALRSLGFEVKVITAIPNYPRGVVYPGYKARKSVSEVIDGLQITRCPIYPSHDRSALRRSVNYASFALSASWIGRRILKSADVALVYSSPETSAIPALLANISNSTPYVLLIQDLWPETVLQTGFLKSPMMQNIAWKSLSALDQVLCSRAAHILVIAPGMKEILIERGVPADKISVMFNWVDESVIFPHPRTDQLRARLGIPTEDLLFTFAGNHGSAQGLMAWIEAIEKVQDLANLHFAFIGQGTEKKGLMDMAASRGLTRTHFLDSIELEEFVQLAADSDAQIVSLRQSPLFTVTIPGKVQSCLALGTAIIGSVAGDAAEIIYESRAGFLAQPNNSSDIARAIREAHSAGQHGLTAAGRFGRDYYLEHMSCEIGSTIMGNVLRAAVRSRSHTSS
jgi:colanic acid biosynthesis glycosyl transferase WcaI